MSVKHITFENIATDDNKILSLSDCSDDALSAHDVFIMSSDSENESIGPSDPEGLLNMSTISEQSSDHTETKPKKRKRVKHDEQEPDKPKRKRAVHKLKYNEFMFHPIKRGEEGTILKYHPDQLVIKLLPNDYVYTCLTPYKQRRYEHNCPFILNSAPSLDQYYQLFKIYKDDTIYNKRHEITMPKDSFFDEVNKKFISNTIVSKRLYKPIYWYHYDKVSKKHEQWPICRAQREYCKLYQESIFDNYESKTTFSIIHSYATHRKLEYPIIICGYDVENSFTSKTPIDPTVIYHRYSNKYTFEYAFVEMLVNYPVLSLCSWASDITTDQ